MVYEPVIWVTEPVAQQQIKSPVIIKGTARVFEATVSYHLKDAEGNILGSGCTMASEGAPGRVSLRQNCFSTRSRLAKDSWKSLRSA